MDQILDRIRADPALLHSEYAALVPFVQTELCALLVSAQRTREASVEEDLACACEEEPPLPCAFEEAPCNAHVSLVCDTPECGTCTTSPVGACDKYVSSPCDDTDPVELALRARRTKDDAHAVRLYNRCIAAHPTCRTHTERGERLLNLKKYEASRADGDAAIRLNCDSARAYRLRALAAWNLNDADRAYRDMCESQRIDYDDCWDDLLAQMKRESAKQATPARSAVPPVPPLDFQSLMQNPQLMSMAQSMMNNPDFMRSMMAHLPTTQ